MSSENLVCFISDNSVSMPGFDTERSVDRAAIPLSYTYSSQKLCELLVKLLTKLLPGVAGIPVIWPNNIMRR